MKFYEVDENHTTNFDGTISFEKTLKEAHEAARAAVTEAVYRPNVRITEVDFLTDKDSLHTVINIALGQWDKHENPVSQVRGRQWGLTNRGGLRDLDTSSEPVT